MESLFLHIFHFSFSLKCISARLSRTVPGSYKAFQPEMDVSECLFGEGVKWGHLKIGGAH